MNLLNELSGRVIGAAINVHRELGPGLDEPSYDLALGEELTALGIPYRDQVPLPLIYKGDRLDAGYRMDFFVGGALIVELKSVERVHPVHEAQLITYLRLASQRLGLLINFHVPLLKLGIQRWVVGLERDLDDTDSSFAEWKSAFGDSRDSVEANVIQAAMEVRKHLGRGLLRSTYSECLSYEMSVRGIRFESRKEVMISFRGRKLPCPIEIDFVIADSLPLMVLSAHEISELASAKFKNQLKFGNWRNGFILNFSAPQFSKGIRRVENSQFVRS